METENEEPLKLPSIVDLYNVEELLPELLEEETLPAIIDISAVEKMTTSGIQLLISACLTANKINAPINIDVTDNDVVISAASTLGLNLSEYLNQENS